MNIPVSRNCVSSIIEINIQEHKTVRLAWLSQIRNQGIVKPEAALRCVSRLYNDEISCKLGQPIWQWIGFILIRLEGHREQNNSIAVVGRVIFRLYYFIYTNKIKETCIFLGYTQKYIVPFTAFAQNHGYTIHPKLSI